MDDSAATVTADPTLLPETNNDPAQDSSFDAVELLASDLQNAANDDTQPEGAVDYSAAIWEELARQSGWDFCVADNANLAA